MPIFVEISMILKGCAYVEYVMLLLRLIAFFRKSSKFFTLSGLFAIIRTTDED